MWIYLEKISTAMRPRGLLQEAEAEVAEFVTRHRELKDEHERKRVVRNGYHQPYCFDCGCRPDLADRYLEGR